MFDYQTMKLMHRHGDDEWVPMTEAGHQNVAQHDSERGWLRARLFRCSQCEEFVAVASASETSADAPAGGSAGG